MEKTTVYIPIDLQAALKDLARRTGRSQAQLIREALATFLPGQQRPWPRSIGAASDGTQAARDSKAWVRKQWSRVDHS